MDNFYHQGQGRIKMKSSRFFSILFILAALIIVGVSATPAIASPQSTDAQALCPNKLKDSFSKSAKCWDKFSGKWFLKNGKLQTRGLVNKYANVGKIGRFSNFTYTARI
ncbi:MAG: hypothetical protein N2D54_12370, partial [Chloroflexota bacterium]